MYQDIKYKNYTIRIYNTVKRTDIFKPEHTDYGWITSYTIDRAKWFIDQEIKRECKNV